MLPVLWHYGGRGSWCHEIVEFLTREHQLHYDCREDAVPNLSEAIVVIKADAAPQAKTLNAELKDFSRVVLIVTGNEEGGFPDDLLDHPNLKLWLQTPSEIQHADRYLPWGWAPGTKRVMLDRPLNWSFAGQNTHERRRECIDALRKIRGQKADGLLYETTNFSAGLSRQVYSQLLSSSKLVPCPSGPITVDTFRVCEALECGAIPIVDTISPTGPYGNYWYRVFGDHIPFPFIADWSTLPVVMEEWLDGWEARAASVDAWWKAKKGEWRRQLAEDCAK